jgi:hypothetical protein
MWASYVLFYYVTNPGLFCEVCFMREGLFDFLVGQAPLAVGPLRLLNEALDELKNGTARAHRNSYYSY